MAQPQRLPAVNGDDGAWGDILNQYLSKEHYNTGLDNPANGGHQTVTIRPGTTAAGTAPLKFASGPLMSSPEVGAVEFYDDGTNAKLYATLTQASVTTRLKVAAYSEGAGATGDIYYRDAMGNFMRLGIGSTGQGLSIASGLPVWAATTNVSFETVSKNLNSYPFSINYTGNVLTSIVYTVGANTITKTLNYTSGMLTSVVLSGSGLPSGISLTKTLTYTGTVLTSLSYV